MDNYAGFDTKVYPKISMMTWLRSNSNLSWCGYYLAPAPNHGDNSWMGSYGLLRDDWGVAAIYVGQQDPSTGHGGYTPSSVLTAAQGGIDALDAVALTKNEGFPAGSAIYLDWESGGLDADGATDYVREWIRGVAGSQTFVPGIYCSHVIANAVVSEIDKIDPTPDVRFWCWKVPSADPHDFEGDISVLPTPNPGGCGFSPATAWQREQRALMTFANGAPIKSLELDISTSTRASPST